MTDLEAAAIERPVGKLMLYYFITSVLSGPFILVTLPIQFFKYETMRYRIDAQGINMRWGILFRREVTLTFARIQDIHLTSNLIERWLGLARIQIQTASGSAEAEMTIEGVPQFEALRDYLYQKMRGARDHHPAPSHASLAVADESLRAVTEALREVRDELRATREALDRHATGGRHDGPL